MAVPIWKDKYIDLGAPAEAGGGVQYFIYCSTTRDNIYFGTAYPKPGASTAKVRINDICADYIHSNFFYTSEQLPFKATFMVYAGVTGSSTLKDTVEFYNDWSYNAKYDPSTDGMNFPVVQTFGAKELIPLSLWSGVPTSATIYMANGQTYSAPLTKSHYSVDQQAWIYLADPYVLAMADYPGAVKVVMGGKTYLASPYCPRYVLYYLNAFGGWDALPIEGKSRIGDSLTHHVNEIVYDNSDPAARGKDNFATELRHTYEFCTRWLTDEQSARMHHLLNSTAIYIHDMESDLIVPGIITAPASERKERKGGFVTYTIEAELAQSRMRR